MGGEEQREEGEGKLQLSGVVGAVEMDKLSSLLLLDDVRRGIAGSEEKALRIDKNESL